LYAVGHGRDNSPFRIATEIKRTTLLSGADMIVPE